MTSTTGTTVATVIPGATYSNGTFTISASQLATASGISWSSPTNSVERFAYMLLQSLYNYEYKTSTAYDADTNLYTIATRNISSYSWGTSDNQSSVITLTASFPFTIESSELSPDSLGEA